VRFAIDMNHTLDWIDAAGDVGPAETPRRPASHRHNIPRPDRPLVVQALTRAEAERLSGAILTTEADRLRLRALDFARKE
jgi:hypothetical protein